MASGTPTWSPSWLAASTCACESGRGNNRSHTSCETCLFVRVYCSDVADGRPPVPCVGAVTGVIDAHGGGGWGECRERGQTVVGLHMHIGSGSDFEHLSKVCDAMVDCALRFEKHGHTLKVPPYFAAFPFAG